MKNPGIAMLARMFCQPGSRVSGKSLRCRSLTALLAGVAAVALAILAAAPLRAQDDHHRKVPGLDKIMSPGPGQQEFDGKVQSLDLQNAVLNVQSLREDNVEIFPIKKTVRISAANGDRLGLDSLEPGANVLVYYEQKADRRSVKGIIVLSAAPAEPKKGPEKKQASSSSPS